MLASSEVVPLSTPLSTPASSETVKVDVVSDASDADVAAEPRPPSTVKAFWRSALHHGEPACPTVLCEFTPFLYSHPSAARPASLASAYAAASTGTERRRGPRVARVDGPHRRRWRPLHLVRGARVVIPGAPAPDAPGRPSGRGLSGRRTVRRCTRPCHCVDGEASAGTAGVGGVDPLVDGVEVVALDGRLALRIPGDQERGRARFRCSAPYVRRGERTDERRGGLIEARDAVGRDGRVASCRCQSPPGRR